MDFEFLFSRFSLVVFTCQNMIMQHKSEKRNIRFVKCGTGKLSLYNTVCATLSQNASVPDSLFPKRKCWECSVLREYAWRKVRVKKHATEFGCVPRCAVKGEISYSFQWVRSLKRFTGFVTSRFNSTKNHGTQLAYHRNEHIDSLTTTAYRRHIDTLNQCYVEVIDVTVGI